MGKTSGHGQREAGPEEALHAALPECDYPATQSWEGQPVGHGHVKAEPSRLWRGQTKPPWADQTRAQYCLSPATLNRNTPTPHPQQNSVSFIWEWRVICAPVFSQHHWRAAVSQCLQFFIRKSTLNSIQS